MRDMQYRSEVISVTGFVQQIACSFLRHGYWFYVTGCIPAGKDAGAVDRVPFLQHVVPVAHAADFDELLLHLGSLGMKTAVLDAHLSHAPARELLTVKRDVSIADIGIAGSIGKITIGGSLIGGHLDNEGAISANIVGGTLAPGSIGAIKVGGNLEGGRGANTGSITSTADIGPVTIGGCKD